MLWKCIYSTNFGKNDNLDSWSFSPLLISWLCLFWCLGVGCCYRGFVVVVVMKMDLCYEVFMLGFCFLSLVLNYTEYRDS